MSSAHVRLYVIFLYRNFDMFEHKKHLNTLFHKFYTNVYSWLHTGLQTCTPMFTFMFAHMLTNAYAHVCTLINTNVSTLLYTQV